MNKSYVITRERVWGREFYKWSDAVNDVVWLRGPSGATRWTRKAEAEKVAAHAGGTVRALPS